MSKTVYILGAGASAHCGAPLMGNFLDVASDLYTRSNQLSPKEREQFARVFRVIGELQRVHSKAQLDLTNIESIFTVLELGRVIQRVPGIDEAQEIGQCITALKDLIVHTLEQKIIFPLERKHIGYPHERLEILAPRDYSRLADMIANQKRIGNGSSIITFNYDIAMDVALAQAGLGPDYAMDRTRQANDQQRCRGQLI